MNLFHLRDVEDPSRGFVARSFSGKERNRLFLQEEENFRDVSLVSGADFREDGRGFVYLDYDHDGWLDICAMSPNEPRFRIFRNQMKAIKGEQNWIEVGLVGGHRGTDSQSKWSARDGWGATIIVTTGDAKRKFQLSCGEGLSSQNSRWIHVGLGASTEVDQIDVLWPSGKTTTQKQISTGERLIIYENPADER